MRALRMSLLIVGVLLTAGAAGFGLAHAAKPLRSAPAKASLQGAPTFELVYQFTGVADDGAQGSVDQKTATTVICTNLSGDFASIEVRVYHWNGSAVYTSTVDLIANQTGTWSTQLTALYFEDAILGDGAGTGAISQGRGEILSTEPAIICNAQVLDPMNLSPDFIVGLPMYDRNGSPVGDVRAVFLPAIKKNLPTN